MDFTKELTEFPSMVHQVIYSSARQMTPLKYSTSTIKEPDLRQSCEAFYSFVMDMLSDMYDNPQAYDLPVHVLEDFLDGKKLNGMKQKYPSKTKTILSRTRNSVDRYLALLSKTAYLGTINGSYLELPKEDEIVIEKFINTSVSPISMERRMKALERVGLIKSDKGFQSLNHSDMFLAMKALATKTKGGTSGFSFYNFSKLDFRNITKSFKPTYEDYFRTLFDQRREYAMKLHKIAVDLGCKVVISTFLKVDFKYKGSFVMCIDSSHYGDLDVRITETYGWDDATLINERLEKESKEFQTYILKHVWRCSACSTSHLGQFVEILGKRNRVCGGGQIGFVWNNPKEDDLEAIQKMINYRCEIIDAIK